MRSLKFNSVAVSAAANTLVPLTPPPTTTASVSTPPAIAQKSPWHSPVPYLFGGLAAMLGLIAFALLLLACSYWRLSGGNSVNGTSTEENGERDVEQGKSGTAAGVKVIPVYEEKIVVIMAGDVKPTFLATPMSTRSFNSFGDGMKKNENFGKGMEEFVEKPKVDVTVDNHDDDEDDDQTSSRSREEPQQQHQEQN